jgi:hypothetical protein
MSEPESYLFDTIPFTKAESSPEVNSESCNQGDIAECNFIYMAKLKGFEVFTPIGHSTKVDIAIRKPGRKFVGVQIKKATYQKGGSWKFMCGSGKPSCAANPKDYGARYTPYKKGDFDILAAYIIEKDYWLFYNLDRVAGKSSIRWSELKNFQNNWEIFDPYFTTP